MFIILAIIIVAVLLQLLRKFCAQRPLPLVHSMPFAGKQYRVGATDIAISTPALSPEKTIICFPGFLENMRYFVALYENSGYEVIFINNANYHSPFESDSVETLNWPTNPFQIGSIEYDGFYLGQAVKELASCDNIVIHGHSRGGGAVLDAGRQFPQLMLSPNKNITAVIEAALVPQAVPARGSPGPIISAITYYFMPLVFTLLSNMSEQKLNKFPMMKPSNAHKTDVLKTLFRNAKNNATLEVNGRDLSQWQKQQGYELYQNYHNIVLLVGERDHVLDNASMIASAERGQQLNSGVRIVRTENTNHFISLENPSVVRELVHKL